MIPNSPSVYIIRHSPWECKQRKMRRATFLANRPHLPITRLFASSPNSGQPHSGATSSPRRLLLGLLTGSALSALAYDGLQHRFEHCGGATRFLRSLRIAATISADYAWSLHGLDPATAEYAHLIRAINQRSAERLLDGCLANGGLYVKIGQGIAAINHILPREYTDTLSRLENECLPRDSDEVRRLFAAEFQGRTPEQLFASFDYEPVAAASLAQVFRAETHDGQQVAVKVQYADLASRFAGDFGTIQLLQSLVKRVHADYNFSWILEEVRANLQQELDFVHEGRNAERCAEDLRRLGGVHVPKVHWELTTGRVLTCEWIDGYKVTDLRRLEADGLRVAEVDRKLFDAFGEQIFGTGFVHADPHPGNVFVRKQKKRAEIVLLDHGLYEFLPTEVRRALGEFWVAIVLQDEEKMRRFAAELGVQDHDQLAEILLQRPMKMGGAAGGQPMSARLTDADLAYMQQMAKQRFDTVLTTLRQMPKAMLFVVRNLNTIRAIARQHGDPLDRPACMARCAQRCLYEAEAGAGAERRGWLARRWAAMRWLVRRVWFEWCLLRFVLRAWMRRTVLVTWAQWMGRRDEVVAILDATDEEGLRVKGM